MKNLETNKPSAKEYAHSLLYITEDKCIHHIGNSQGNYGDIRIEMKYLL